MKIPISNITEPTPTHPYKDPNRNHDLKRLQGDKKIDEINDEQVEKSQQHELSQNATNKRFCSGKIWSSQSQATNSHDRKGHKGSHRDRKGQNDLHLKTNNSAQNTRKNSPDWTLEFFPTLMKINMLLHQKLVFCTQRNR